MKELAQVERAGRERRASFKLAKCFEDRMAVACPVCQGTAEIAYQMTHRNSGPRTIQIAVDAKWRQRARINSLGPSSIKGVNYGTEMRCRDSPARRTGNPGKKTWGDSYSRYDRREGTRVRGYGAYPNLFADDWTTEHIKIEIFAQAENVDALVSTIMDIARVCSAGDGVMAVIPVERFFRVRTASEALP